jgi:hypothetical protein
MLAEANENVLAIGHGETGWNLSGRGAFGAMVRIWS